MKAVVAMLHGGMDAEVLRLVQEHEDDRVLSSRGQRSLGHSNSGGSETSSLTSKAHRSSSFLEKSSLVNRELSGSSSSANQNSPPSEIYVDGSHLAGNPESRLR